MKLPVKIYWRRKVLNTSDPNDGIPVMVIGTLITVWLGSSIVLHALTGKFLVNLQGPFSVLVNHDLAIAVFGLFPFALGAFIRFAPRPEYLIATFEAEGLHLHEVPEMWEKAFIPYRDMKEAELDEIDLDENTSVEVLRIKTKNDCLEIPMEEDDPRQGPLVHFIQEQINVGRRSA